MRKLARFCAIFLLTTPLFALADEDANHFPALEAPDVATAFCNIQSYNKKLIDITNKAKIEALDMVKIHELTYTLENSLARLKTTLEEAAVALEEVHLASERLDPLVINEQSKTYLSGTMAMLTPTQCAN